MRRFTSACYIDIEDYPTMQKHYTFVRRMRGRWLTGQHYLRRDSQWDLKWKPLLESYIDFVQREEQGSN